MIDDLCKSFVKRIDRVFCPVRPVGQVAQNFQVAGNGSMAGHFSISVHAIMGATYKPLGLF